MKRSRAWFRFARRMWISLGIGWLALPIGLVSLLRMDQAGAILVCAAIVAEVLHEKRHRLFVDQVQPGLSQTYIYREIEVPGEIRKDIEITPHRMQSGKTTVNTSSWALYNLAKPDEFYPDRESRLWDLERTMKRAERTVEYAIVATAVAGTLLWAFA